MQITTVAKYGYTLLKFDSTETMRDDYNLIWGKMGEITSLPAVNGTFDFPWFNEEPYALETLERCISKKEKYNFEFGEKIEDLING